MSILCYNGVIMENTEPRITLRMTPELHKALKEQAKVNRRSLNGHILYLLEKSVSDESSPDKPT